MAQETLKITITADNKQAVDNINQTIQATDKLDNSLKKLPQASGQATQALTNLSRVAQDAPYGFIGIANNLNPLLESFQRLSDASKKAGTSLAKELGAALTGPAGIGIALGVVSSLIVAFGDDISNFISEKLSGLGKAFTLESETMSKASDAFVKASVDVSNLKNSLQLAKEGVISKDKFLKEFNSTLGDTIAKTNDLATAEKFLTDGADDYIQMVFKKAVAQEASAQAAKKQIEAELLRSKPVTPGIGTALTAIFGNPAQIGMQAAESKNAILNGLNDQVSVLETIRKKYQNEADAIQKSLTDVFGAADISRAEKKPKKTLTYEEASAQINARIRARDLTETPDPVEDTAIKDAEKQHNEYLKWLSDWTKKKQDITKKDYGEEQKAIEQQNQAYRRFAETMANEVTGAIRGAWDALQSGQSVIEALGNSFLKLAEDIAFAIIKAEILAAIQTAIGVTTGGIGGGGGGFLSMLGKLLGGGMAEGGIVTAPTLTMVGEGNEHEAVMPLSKLGAMMNRTFNAGSMSGGGIQNGQFVLKGNDLVLALQRSNANLTLKRGF